LHGALLDSEILAEVYLELIGGRQPDLTFSNAGKKVVNMNMSEKGGQNQRPEALASRLNDDEKTEHQEFIETLGENVIWQDYIEK